MANKENSHRREALRQFIRNDGSGMVFAYDKEIIDRRIAYLESENDRLEKKIKLCCYEKEQLQGDTNE